MRAPRALLQNLSNYIKNAWLMALSTDISYTTTQSIACWYYFNISLCRGMTNYIYNFLCL